MNIKRLSLLAMSLAAPFLLSSCGKGGEVSETPPAGSGVMEIKVTDAPAANGLSLLVTLSEIEVKGSGDWREVLPGPARIDLNTLIGVEESLGKAYLPQGRYTQLRFKVADPVISHSGEEIHAGLENDRPVLSMDATIAADRVTVVVIDIDGADSFAFAGDKPVFEAKARIKVREG